MAQVEQQWEGVFASLAPLADLAKSYYPPNLSEALPTLEELEKLLVDEGVPLRICGLLSLGSQWVSLAWCLGLTGERGSGWCHSAADVG